MLFGTYFSIGESGHIIIAIVAMENTTWRFLLLFMNTEITWGGQNIIM